MSGAKCAEVRMSPERAQQLEAQARRANMLDSQNRILEQANRQRDQRMAELQKRMESSARRHEQHIGRLNQDLQALERQTRTQLDQQRKHYQTLIEQSATQQRAYTDQCVRQLDQKVQKQFGQQRAEYLRLIKEQDQQFQTALRQQGELLQHNIDQLAQSMQARLQHDQEIAEEWHRYLSDEAAYIRDNYRHELFAPGELAAIEDRLRLTTGNLNQQVFQSAIAGAQEAYLQARRLREKLELLELQWQIAHQAAQGSIATALLLLDEQRDIEYVLDTDQSLRLEVDFWSQGAWGELRAQVEARRQMLDQQRDSLDQATLQTIQEEGLAAAERLTQIVTNAKTALLASIHRRDLQELILERLEELGYHHVDSTYEQGDFRRAYHMKLENANHDRIVTVVSPTGHDGGLANELSINFYDDSINEAVRKERLDHIREQISAEEGLSVSSLQCEKGYERGNAPTGRLDFETLRQTAAGQGRA